MSLVAVIPVGSLESAKSRLGSVLDAEERRDLVHRMLERTVRACIEATAIDETIVVSPDPATLVAAERLGARTLAQVGGGLNEGIRVAQRAAATRGARAILVVPIDLPLITSDSLAPILTAIDAAGAPAVVLVADRHGRGTNALAMTPADAIEPCFGGDSAAAHRAQAMAAGARVVDLDGPLAIDLDTTDDLALVETLAPELLRAP